MKWLSIPVLGILLTFSFCCCCWKICCLPNYISFVGNMSFLCVCFKNFLWLWCSSFSLQWTYGLDLFLFSQLIADFVASWILWFLSFNHYKKCSALFSWTVPSLSFSFLCLKIILFLILSSISLITLLHIYVFVMRSELESDLSSSSLIFSLAISNPLKLMTTLLLLFLNFISFWICSLFLHDILYVCYIFNFLFYISNHFKHIYNAFMTDLLSEVTGNPILLYVLSVDFLSWGLFPNIFCNLGELIFSVALLTGTLCGLSWGYDSIEFCVWFMTVWHQGLESHFYVSISSQIFLDHIHSINPSLKPK